MNNINLYWEGPFKLNKVIDKKKGNDEKIDYGIYQIYGSHPVYGNDVLLYVGKAVQQTFSIRIAQESTWQFNQDADNVKVYFGRLIGNRPKTTVEWDDMISKAEEILIYSHRPAHNSSNINSIQEIRLSNTHILNWGCYRSLSAEVSSMQLFDETQEENENYFSMDDF